MTTQKNLTLDEVLSLAAQATYDHEAAEAFKDFSGRTPYAFAMMDKLDKIALLYKKVPDVVDSFEPSYSSWRHGGWYVNNVRFPEGHVGCVSNNYDDKQWRIVDEDHAKTYPSRDAAAKAQLVLCLQAQEELAPYIGHLRNEQLRSSAASLVRHMQRDPEIDVPQKAEGLTRIHGAPTPHLLMVADHFRAMQGLSQQQQEATQRLNVIPRIGGGYSVFSRDANDFCALVTASASEPNGLLVQPSLPLSEMKDFDPQVLRAAVLRQISHGMEKPAVAQRPLLLSEFRQTGQVCSDMSEITGNPEDRQRHGFVYEGGSFIEDVSETHGRPAFAIRQGDSNWTVKSPGGKDQLETMLYERHYLKECVAPAAIEASLRDMLQLTKNFRSTEAYGFDDLVNSYANDPLSRNHSLANVYLQNQKTQELQSTPAVMGMAAIEGYNVRTVFDGEGYGSKDQLTHSGPPMIEFYDSTSTDTERGYFISRYMASAFANREPAGLLLDGASQREVSLEGMTEVRQIAEQAVALHADREAAKAKSVDNSPSLGM